MSKPSQTHLYAGLLIYRLQRNVEFLLINDSFTNKKHWVCPKGLVLGQEDELKCALRETFETTGLGPKLLHIDEGFKLELKYLSGTKPKKVIYYLAQLLDNHARLHANAEGIHLQWCNQQLASEKAIFKSMQDVFKHAQNFIETKRMNQKQQHQHQRQYKHNNSNNNNSNNNGRRNFNQQQQQQQHRTSTPPRPRVNNGDTNDISTMNSPHFRHQQNQQYKLDRSYSSSSMGSLTSPTSPKLQHTSNNNGHYHDTVTDFSNNNNNNININNNNGFNYRPTNSYHHSNNNNNNNHQQHQLNDNNNNNNNNNNHLHGNGSSNSNNSNDQSKPLFKTRLCERFESESGCPYGSRCTFAHGIEELRGRNIINENQLNPSNEEHNQQQHYHHHQRNGNGDKGSDSHGIHQQQQAKDLSENPLYKTKLCERFMKDQFCQYGPKCHFAHGRNELKERPIQRELDDNNNIAIPPTATTVLPANTTTPIKDNHFNDNKSSSSHPYSLSPLQPIPPLACQQSSLEGPHQSIASEIITTTTTSKGSPSTIKAPTPLLHNDIQQQQQQKENLLQKQPTPIRSLQDNVTLSLKEKLDQVKINNNNNDNINIKKRNVDPVSDPVMNGDIKTTDKSWMKVVHLTKEDQAKLAIPPVSKVPTPSPSKVAQEEAIIEDLTLFFKSPESNITQQSQNLAKDVKQVTKVEMRNDLTKSQLFYILLASLLQDTTDCPVGSILKSREKLFKTFVKNVSDQRLLLKAWDKCVKRYPSLLSKSVLVLSQWYECDLLDEDACYEWYDTLDDTNDIKKKVTKFIDWLKTADEEEEENDD